MPAPKSVICYICGREYGSRSITIHESQCMTKWQNENKQLPPNQRRQPPQKPQLLPSIGGHGGGREASQRDIDRWNEIAVQSAASQLLQCENCGRTFNVDRLAVHQKSCRPGNAAKPIRGKENEVALLSARRRPNKQEQNSNGNINVSRPLTATLTNPKVLNQMEYSDYPGPEKGPRSSRQGAIEIKMKPETKKPSDYNVDSGGFKFAAKPGHRPGGGQFVHCYICNQKFTIASLKFHEPSCLKKWQITNDELPPHLRRKTPIKPKEFDMLMNPDGDHFATKTMGSNSMSQAKVSGKGTYNIDAYNNAMQEAAQTNMAQCPHCKRTFNPDRIQKHESICRKTKNIVPKLKQDHNPTGPSKIGVMPSAVNKAAYDIESDRKRKIESVVNNEKGKKHGFVICPRCGRQYTHASIQIHLPRCGVVGGKQSGGMNKSKSNKNSSMSNYDNEGYGTSKCRGCGRTFAPNRLEIHEKVCLNNPNLFQSKSKAPIRTAQTPKWARNGPPGNQINNQTNQQNSTGVDCPNCGRKFRQDRINAHLSACRPY